MNTITFAFKKGRKGENSHALLFDVLITHWPRTVGRFSHGEFIDPDNSSGWSSTFLKDGCVRNKPGIDWTNGDWTLVTFPGDPYALRDRIKPYLGWPYDWFGLLFFVLPWRVTYREWIFCTELLAIGLEEDQPWSYHPNKLFALVSQLPDAVIKEFSHV